METRQLTVEEVVAEVAKKIGEYKTIEHVHATDKRSRSTVVLVRPDGDTSRMCQAEMLHWSAGKEVADRLTYEAILKANYKGWGIRIIDVYDDEIQDVDL